MNHNYHSFLTHSYVTKWIHTKMQHVQKATSNILFTPDREELIRTWCILLKHSTARRIEAYTRCTSWPTVMSLWCGLCVSQIFGDSKSSPPPPKKKTQKHISPKKQVMDFRGDPILRQPVINVLYIHMFTNWFVRRRAWSFKILGPAVPLVGKWNCGWGSKGKYEAYLPNDKGSFVIVYLWYIRIVCVYLKIQRYESPISPIIIRETIYQIHKFHFY